MRTLGVCLAIIGGALITVNNDVIGGTIVLVIAAGCFWWNALESRDSRANLVEFEQDDER